jgi:cell filamentation protein
MRDYIYCYSNGVLVNRFNICDQKELDTVESNITSVKLVQADKLEKIFRDNGFTFNGLKALHRYLFEDIYYWAGCPRRIDIEKPERVLNGLSVQYSHHKNIAKDIEQCIEALNRIQWNTLDLDGKAHKFTRLIAALWQVHPFREGNTRTVITFACEYAKQHGFPMDKSLLAEHPKYVRESLVMASIGEYSEYKYLERIFKDSIQREQMELEQHTAAKDEKELIIGE